MPKPRTEESPSWETSNVSLTMFTSLMIILLAFFILLTSKSVVDESRQIEAMGSLLGTFGSLPGGQAVQGQKVYISPQSSPMTEIQNDINLIKQVFNQSVVERKVHYLKGRDRRIISIESAVLFPQDGVQIKEDMKPALSEVAAIINKADYMVVIEGHTDDQPPMTEAFENNWQISSLRAVNVMNYLAGAGQVAPTRMAAYGYGGFQPVVVNNSPKNRARNNRVDIVIDFTLQNSAEDYQDKHRGPLEFDWKGFHFPLQGKEKPESGQL